MYTEERIQQNSVIRFFLVVFGLIIFTYNVICDYNGEFAVVTAWTILAISVYLMVYYRKKWELFILFFFMMFFNYSIMMGYYISPVRGTFFTMYATTKASYFAENIVLLYMICLCLLTPQEMYLNGQNNIYDMPEKHNDIIVYAIILFLVYLFLFQYERPDANERGGGSTLYEYSIILAILGYTYSGKGFAQKLLTGIVFLLAAQNILFGGRVVGMQLFMVIFLMNYAHFVTVKQAIPLLIAGFLAFTVLGATRGDYRNLRDIFSEVLHDVATNKFANDTSYSAYHTSITFLKMEYVGWAKRLYMFKNFLLYIFVGSSNNQGLMSWNVAEFTLRRYTHYYGGVLPIYLHFYLGMLGVVLSAAFTGFYTRLIAMVRKTSSSLVKCVAVYIAATIPRWYLYSPSGLTRGCMLLCIAYAVCAFGDRLMRGREKAKAE